MRMKELEFQELMVDLINEKLGNKSKFKAYKGEAIFYELKLNENLELNQKDLLNPKRGKGAFETDVTIFLEKEDKKIPIIVIEVKDNITTHDVITYSNKAEKHKIVYPYLRYGLVSYGINSIPKRFFLHNKHIDFYLTLKDFTSNKDKLVESLYKLVKKELSVFEELQNILHNDKKLNFYQKSLILKKF